MTATGPHHNRRLLLAANEAAATYFRACLLSDAGAGPRGYLTDRGFAALLHDTPWTVGYAPAGWTHLATTSATKGSPTRPSSTPAWPPRHAPGG